MKKVKTMTTKTATQTNTQAKSTNTVQTIKLLVMANSLLVLMAVFLVFFTDGLSTETPSSNQVAVAKSQIVSDITPVALQNNHAPNEQVSDELNGLPYVSRSGLQQQAAVQVVSVKSQPRVQARSSR